MLEALGYAVAYSLVGILLLALGFFVIDLLTPGKLAVRIWTDRSVNAGIVLAAGLVGLGGVIWSAIWHNAESGFGSALGWTVAFGVLGVLLQALAFVALDVVTPGRLGDVVCEVAFHPAALVTAASQLAVSLIVVACIS